MRCPSTVKAQGCLPGIQQKELIWIHFSSWNNILYSFRVLYMYTMYIDRMHPPFSSSHQSPQLLWEFDRFSQQWWSGSKPRRAWLVIGLHYPWVEQQDITGRTAAYPLICHKSFSLIQSICVNDVTSLTDLYMKYKEMIKSYTVFNKITSSTEANFSWNQKSFFWDP